MLHKEIIGLALLLFLGWVFVSSSGTERIQRFCAPVAWVGNVTVSATALASPDSQKSVGRSMNKVTYGCEYLVWRLFYQSSYNEYMAASGKQGYGTPEPVVRDAPVEDPASEEATAAKPARVKEQVKVESAHPAPDAEAPAAVAPAVSAKKSSGAKPVRVLE